MSGRLYGTCHLFSTTGFCARGEVKPTDLSPIRDEMHPSKARKTFAFLARRIYPDGSLGPIFALWEHLPESLAFDIQPASELPPDELLAVITELVSEPNDLPTSSYEEKEHILSFCRRLPCYSAD